MASNSRLAERTGVPSGRPTQAPMLAELAERPLFRPLQGLLHALAGSASAPDARANSAGDTAPASLAALNALRASPLASHAGDGVRFVPPDADRIAYETRIATRGEVVTRPHNWHDFFNALVWMRFPLTKHALASLHADGMRVPAPDGRRGPARDAATQFDESGVVVAASDPSLLELLAQRRWKELFWTRRQDVGERMRFVVFGHGLYDALRAPFYRICGRAAVVTVAQERIDGPVEALCRDLDACLAERFTQRNWYPRPGVLLALPLLGIPGVCEENEQPGYYDDAVQFRPLPSRPL